MKLSSIPLPAWVFFAICCWLAALGDTIFRRGERQRWSGGYDWLIVGLEALWAPAAFAALVLIGFLSGN
jgi:hypothetical protein